MTADPLREHLIRLLEWEEAHVGFNKAIAAVPADQRGARPPGIDWSLWQLLEHLRIAQSDLLDFCVNPAYVHTKAWPDDYWPKEPVPPSDDAWAQSVADVIRTRDEMTRVVRETPDLVAPVPTGSAQQTYLRSILLVADHAAYHVGQIVAVRRALGIWR